MVFVFVVMQLNKYIEYREKAPYDLGTIVLRREVSKFKKETVKLLFETLDVKYTPDKHISSLVKTKSKLNEF